MKTLKLKKDVVEHLSMAQAKDLKGGTLLSDIPTVCVSAIGSCLPSCKGLTCNIAPCDPDPTTVRPPCKDISVVDPGHTMVNCLVTRQTCAC